jgi:hypothetical protein
MRHLNATPITHSKEGFIEFDEETFVCKIFSRFGQPEIKNRGLKIIKSLPDGEHNLVGSDPPGWMLAAMKLEVMDESG